MRLKGKTSVCRFLLWESDNQRPALQRGESPVGLENVLRISENGWEELRASLQPLGVSVVKE